MLTIKFITENMDYTDAERINKEINDLTKKTNPILNNQVISKTNLINRFQNITKHINIEQDILVKSIQNIQEQTRNSLNAAINSDTNPTTQPNKIQR